jgi:hypothetical protein
MAKYVYLPVPTASTVKIANDLNTGRAEKGKSEYTLLSCTHSGLLKYARRKIGRRVLAVTQPGDVVYIIAHGYQPVGSRAALEIGSDRDERQTAAWPPKFEGGTPKTYKPEDLAAHLKTEGLADEVELRVFACGSGLNGPSGADCYAKKLKEALVGLGYSKNTFVEGYLGDMSGGYGKRLMTSPGPQGKIHSGRAQGSLSGG